MFALHPLSEMPNAVLLFVLLIISYCRTKLNQIHPYANGQTVPYQGQPRFQDEAMAQPLREQYSESSIAQESVDHFKTLPILTGYAWGVERGPGY